MTQFGAAVASGSAPNTSIITVLETRYASMLLSIKLSVKDRDLRMLAKLCMYLNSALLDTYTRYSLVFSISQFVLSRESAVIFLGSPAYRKRYTCNSAVYPSSLGSVAL